MKKVLFYVFTGMFFLSFIACNSDKPATNLDELKEKYDDKEFKDCDEFITAAEEMMDVYFATVDKAAEGDEDAKKEVEEFEDFMDGFEEQAEKFEEECPEKFEEFEEKFEAKMEDYMEKIMKIYGLDDLGDDEWDDEWDEEWEEEWDEELSEELVNELLEELEVE